MSSFREQLEADIHDVFLNLEEFAEERVFRGQPLVCIVDDVDALASTAASDGLRNASGLGILHCDRQVLCRAEDCQPVPLPGERVEMDGFFWIVGDGVSVCEGLLTLPLDRAY